MDFHKKETQKYLIPIGLALAGFIVAVISILFGYFYLPNLGAAFFRLILACVLPVILLLMYQSKSAAKTALPLMVIGAVLLGLQLLGTLYTLFAAIAGAGFGLFRWIPGSSILGHLVLALAYFFDCFSWGFYFFRDLFELFNRRTVGAAVFAVQSVFPGYLQRIPAIFASQQPA